jgi:hypothetical protein
MNYVITKLDKRYAYYKQFPYMIEFRKNTDWGLGTGVLDFDRVRKWMNESWGWSQDIETRAEMVKSKVRMNIELADWTDINQHWAWSCRYQEYRIYVSESALSLFKLKWSQDATA